MRLWGVLKKIWRVKHDVEIELVANNIFTFHFSSEDDRMQVLAGSPWTFDGALIVLEKPTGKGDIWSMKFDMAEFLVQIHQVSLLCMSKDIGCFLGSMVGEVKEVDVGDTVECSGEFLRVRINMNIGKPLRRCLRVDAMGDGEETVMLLRYERLTFHCYRCRRLGYYTRECTRLKHSMRLLLGSGCGHQYRRRVVICGLDSCWGSESNELNHVESDTSRKKNRALLATFEKVALVGGELNVLGATRANVSEDGGTSRNQMVGVGFKEVCTDGGKDVMLCTSSHVVAKAEIGERKESGENVEEPSQARLELGYNALCDVPNEETVHDFCVLTGRSLLACRSQ
ncbi:hypothetical protein Ddye_001216 [Dipteronia dyeriana]|uniref:DUF4283 domain-containing protein n=1 Tax=Dipteronia dyeriana TaxID=168575 RepID=A0AAD9XNW2_9ROSI|nr:hypothetical protein Ddye_001216 [Dipteronia dyeriana]